MPRHRPPDATRASLHARLRAVPRIRKADVAAPRRFVEAVIHALRTGVAWEDLLARFGRPDSVQRRFRFRAREGLWDEPVLDGVPTDGPGTVMPGSSACEAQHFASGARGGGEDLGRSRDGLTTKIHGPGRPPRSALVLPDDAGTGRRLPPRPGTAGRPDGRAPDRRPRRSPPSGQRSWNRGTPTPSAPGAPSAASRRRA